MTTSKKKKAARVVKTTLVKPSAAAPAVLPVRPFAEVIDIVARPLPQAQVERMLTWIAKNEPELFLRAHKASTVIVSQEWARAIVYDLAHGNKVSAIKATRERTGLGLKEAKDICDNVYGMLPALGFKEILTPAYPSTAVIPAGANQTTVDMLVAAAKAIKGRP